jgi:hypothetical protein
MVEERPGCINFFWWRYSVSCRKSKRVATILPHVHTSSYSALFILHTSRGEHPCGSLSYLLSIMQVDMVEIFKIYSFYDERKGALLFRVFKTWVAASFDVRTVEVATFCYPAGSPHKKIQLMKMGLGGEHPSHPASQLNEKLDTPRFQMQADPKGQSSKDSLMIFFTSHLKHRQLQLLKLGQPQHQI